MTSSTTGTVQAIDGEGLARLVAVATSALEHRQEEINALNVFPVPDGDTGTNMHLTLLAVLEKAEEAHNASAGEVAKTMARAALLGARGNSGLILAQFFKGLAAGIGDAQEVTGREFAKGMAEAQKAAYRAVQNPVEGTMLTVMRESSDSANRALARSSSLETVLAAAARRSTITVKKTPEMLQTLRDAGVVDAGGHGFSVFLHGVLDGLRGKTPAEERSSSGGDLDGPVATHVRQEFVQAAIEAVHGYCTSFVITGEGLDPDAIRTHVTQLGESCVVAGDETYVKVHVHPQNPGPTLEYAANLGVLSGISILNMDEQSREWAAHQAQHEAETVPPPSCRSAVVTVALGDGMIEIMESAGMGAAVAVSGGDSMNPSVAEILSAIERAPSDEVVVLPNNKNVILAAKQAKELSEKTVLVVPTRTVQAGIAALLAFSSEQSALENAEVMTRAADAVVAGAVTTATRDVKLDGKSVHKGDTIGLVNDEILVVGADADEVVVELVCHANVDGEIVTLYRGADTPRERAEQVAAELRRKRPGPNVEVLDGGQPFYPYLIAIE